MNDVPKFETALAATNIEYLDEDQYLEVTSVGQKIYYFKLESADTIDSLCKELGIIPHVGSGRDFS